MLSRQRALQGSGMSPKGVCLATTLWLQATCALIAPAILLHIWSSCGSGRCSSDGGGEDHGASSSSDASSSCADDAECSPVAQKTAQLTALGVLGQCVEEQPVETGVCLSMLTWLALRTAVARLLPA